MLYEPIQITAAAVDRQKNIYLANAMTKKVDMYISQENLYANLWVEVENIYIKEYPKVAIEVSVRNRKGIPIVSLEKQNFIIEENNERKRIAVRKLFEDKKINPFIVMDTYGCSPNQKITLKIIVDQLYKNLLEEERLSIATLKYNKKNNTADDVRILSSHNKNRKSTSLKLESDLEKITPIGSYPNSEWSKIFKYAIQQNLNHKDRKGDCFYLF